MGMKMKGAALLIILFINCAPCCAQRPYFQQEVNYTIHVTLEDEQHFLHGDITMEYINHSPDELDSIFIHLWPNAYKNNKTALAQNLGRDKNFMLWYLPEASRGFIDSLNFKIAGERVRWSFYKEFEDIAVLELAKPLRPNEQILISTPFRVKIPSAAISRLGHVGESYQITQWFPKPAVYDRDGWHQMPYINQGEFYSEFGSFDVSITLPDNYTVGATGDLQTEGEIIRLNELASQNSTRASDDFPASSSNMKTLRYVQQNVHDFGWFADKRFIVRKGEVTLPESNRKVTTLAMFTPGNAEVWETHGIKAIHDALYYYSLWTGDYPYNNCTAVDGTISAGGGMEYPNVTVIGGTSNPFQLELVIIHEVGHNWFYGMLGTNERDNAWMDEGINSFFESRVLETLHPELHAGSGIFEGSISAFTGFDKFPYRYQEELMYLFNARGNKDQPMQFNSEDFTSTNYGTVVYKKSSLAFNYLLQYLGEDVFNQCMSDYFEQWKFKHPSPEDLEEVFETASGKDLNWFFDELIATDAKMNYKAIGVHEAKHESWGNGLLLNVMNKGEFVSPFSVSIIREDSTVSTQWFDGHPSFTAKKYLISNAQKGDVLKLNMAPGLPEYDRNNNTIRTKGLLRKTEKYSLRFITGIDDPDRSQLFFIPMMGWNYYNRWMIGASVHNQTIPLGNFRYSISPLYSFSTNSINGFAKIEVDDGIVGAGIKTQKFAEDRVTYDYYSQDLDDVTGQYALNYWIIHPYLRFNLFPSRLKKDLQGLIYVSAKLKYESRQVMRNNKWQFQPFDYEFTLVRINAEVNRNFLFSNLHISVLAETCLENEKAGVQSNITYDFIYETRTKAKLITRLYYGFSNGLYNTSGQKGQSDYGYDYLFLGRNETDGIWSQQFIRNQGALAAPSFQQISGSLLSFNLETDLPIKFPLAVYAGIAWTPNNISHKQFGHSLGITLPIARKIFQIYVPLLFSNQSGWMFPETILFELDLNMLNPFEILRKLDP